MFESRSRFHLGLAIAMFVALCIPSSLRVPFPNGMALLLRLLGYESYVEPGILAWLSRLPYTLGALSVPILMLLNLFMPARPTLGWKTLYRISLLVFSPLMWWLTFRLALPAGWESIGFWAMPIVVTVAVLSEVGFMLKSWSEKAEDTD